MRIKHLSVLSTAAFALIAGTVQAAEDKQSRDVPNFNQMDKNNDGALTPTEAAGNPRLAAHFNQVDDNGDGRLTRGEYLAIMARQDLYMVRDSLAEFINPEGKPPLAIAKQEEAAQTVPIAASPQLVRNVQDRLHAEGIDAGPVDGIWGPRTHLGLSEFQEKQGLKATGQLNAGTLTALGIQGEQTPSTGDSASAGATRQRSSGYGSAGLFERADKDRNGYVSREEFNSTLGETQAASR